MHILNRSSVSDIFACAQLRLVNAKLAWVLIRVIVANSDRVREVRMKWPQRHRGTENMVNHRSFLTCFSLSLRVSVPLWLIFLFFCPAVRFSAANAPTALALAVPRQVAHARIEAARTFSVGTND